jgi:hypothetical protein
MAVDADYSPEFEAAWANYPRRHGNNPKKGAWTQWQKRVKEGVDQGELLKQTVLYKRHCEREQKIGTSYTMMAQTFYGPSRPFESDWGPEEQKAAGPDWQARHWERKREAPVEPVRTEGWQPRRPSK